MSVLSRRLPGRRDLLAAAAAFPMRYPCLLESAARGTAQARYDLLLWHNGDYLALGADGKLCSEQGELGCGAFLATLDQRWAAAGIATERLRMKDGEELPFVGGWALYLGYELAAQIEPRLRLPPSSGPRPLALALRCPAAAIVDHQRHTTWLLAEPEHAQALAQLAADLEHAPAIEAAGPAAALQLHEEPPSQFLAGVAQLQAQLRAGEIFQANLSRRWWAEAATEIAPAALYARLRQANPAPFAGLLQRPGWALASSSPERLLELRGGWAQMRPIAGTRPRLAEEDAPVRIRELVGHPKERAEHVMLVDLARNDLGRICQPGSIEVNELMTVESYAHVHHLVSNVRGRLRTEVTPGEAIAAVFPGGTITGCPKLRCMEILAELEQAPRGGYTGALGYLDRCGALDLNILIRSLELTGRQLEWRAGAGIVIDSQAPAELEETQAKARGVLRALTASMEPPR